MCTIFVFTKPDNDHPDPAIDALKFKVGHVIEILDEDDASGGDEVDGKNALGWWQKIVLPGVPAEKYRHLLAGDPVPKKTDPAPAEYPRLRVNVLDVASLKQVSQVDAKGAVIAAEAAVVARVTAAPKVAVAVAEPIADQG